MVEKIGVVEVIRISAHGSGLYLRLPKDLVEWHRLKKGDRLKVKIEEVIRVGVG